MTNRESPTAASGPLLLADISGYTSFLRAVSEQHKDDAFANGAIPPAYGVMSTLLDGIIERLVPPMTLSKIEGDAVFVFATDMDVPPRGSALLECFAECHASFRRQLETAKGMWTCWCDACARIEGLDLKFVLHAGWFVIHPVAGGRELAGQDVVMTHRLLKNGVARVLGQDAYVLITEPAATGLELPRERGIPVVETYEHYEPMPALAFPLGRGAN